MHFVKGVSHVKWRWGAEEEEHVEQIEKKPCRQQKYRQRTDKEANVSKDRLINDTIRHQTSESCVLSGANWELTNIMTTGCGGTS